jgi:hypothetical protein
MQHDICCSGRRDVRHDGRGDRRSLGLALWSRKGGASPSRSANRRGAGRSLSRIVLVFLALSSVLVSDVAAGVAGGADDFNGDGRGDRFRYHSVTGAWTLELSNTGGTFTSKSGRWSLGWAIWGADFNGDRITDLLVYNETTGGWYKCFSDGAGGFRYVGGVWSPNWHVYVGDYNGDGKSDVFVYNPTSGAWYTCLTTGTDGAGFSYVGGTWSPAWQVYPMDLDGNSLTDLFVYNDTTGQWYRCLSTGTGAFTYDPGAWPTTGWQIHSGDFNGDELSDLFLYNAASGKWFVCLSTGTGFVYQAGQWSPGWTVAMADLDGDGRTDVFVYNVVSGIWYECVTTGQGFVYYGGQWSPGWDLRVTDSNADGRSDLLVYNSTTGSSFSCLNTGLGRFTSAGGNWGTGLTVFSTAYGGDGKPLVTVTGLTVSGFGCSAGICSAMAGGSTILLTATAQFSNSTTQNVTSQAQWDSTNTNVATVSAAGLVTPKSVGEANVMATYQGRVASLTLRVQPIPPPVTVTGLTVSGSGCSAGICSAMAGGSTIQLTATTQLSNSTTQNVTGQARWESTNTNVATVSAAGLVTPKSVGESDVVATYQGRVASLTVRVQPFVWSRSGVGDMVFDMPTTVSRVRIVGTYTGYSSNFIVWVGHDLLVNELLGTGWGPTRYDGTLLTTGGVTQITHSSGVSWSFTEVR